MNRQQDFDQLMREWVDAGEDRLPVHHLHGALAEIETTRQRGARRALLEDFLMRLQPFAAPLAIAAVLVAAIGTAAIVTRPTTVGPEQSLTPAPATPAPSESEAPTESPEPTPAASAPAPTEEPTPDVPQETSFGWSVPFTMTVPAAWSGRRESPATTYAIDAGAGRFIVLTRTGPDAVEGWVERLTAESSLTVSEPRPVEIGGAAGVTMDAQLSEGESEYVLMRDGTVSWNIDPVSVNRLWIVDVDGEAILIVTEANESAFESWTATVEDALSTLEWGE